jgi:hypothetical protein
MISTKQQHLTIYIFEFFMYWNFTNETCLSQLPIFTFVPCSYKYPGTSTGTRPAGCSTLVYNNGNYCQFRSCRMASAGALWRWIKRFGHGYINKSSKVNKVDQQVSNWY